MDNQYSDLLGRFVHPTKGTVTHGAASMTTQVFTEGGLKKKLDQAHMNGYEEGYRDAAEDAYERGYKDGLKAQVFALVHEALAEKAKVQKAD